MPIKKTSVIGVVIPSYYPGDAIHNVIKTISLGVKQFFKNSDYYIVVVDSSDKITQKKILETANNIGDNVILHFGSRRITKGKAIFIGLNILKKKEPDVVLFIDSDLKSIKPQWIKGFCEPLLNNQADFIAPFYVRDKYDSLITNHIIYPVVYSLFGTNLRQPIGGDFGLSKKILQFYLKKPFFNPEVDKFGIDIWLSLNAIAHEFKIGQVFLGTKDHGITIKDSKFPEKSLGVMFVEVVKTLFDLVIVYKSIWQKQSVIEVKTFGTVVDTIPIPVGADSNNLWQTFKRLYPKYKHSIRGILDKQTTMEIEKIFYSDKPDNKMTIDLWINVLFSYIVQYSKINNDSQKKQFIESLLPIYFSRIASFVAESQSWDNLTTERKIQQDVTSFSKIKASYF